MHFYREDKWRAEQVCHTFFREPATSPDPAQDNSCRLETLKDATRRGSIRQNETRTGSSSAEVLTFLVLFCSKLNIWGCCWLSRTPEGFRCHNIFCHLVKKYRTVSCQAAEPGSVSASGSV